METMISFLLSLLSASMVALVGAVIYLIKVTAEHRITIEHHDKRLERLES